LQDACPVPQYYERDLPRGAKVRNPAEHGDELAGVRGKLGDAYRVEHYFPL
jgi:hypothetical protein